MNQTIPGAVSSDVNKLENVVSEIHWVQVVRSNVLNIVSLAEHLIFGINFHWISVVLLMQNYLGKS